MEVKDKMTESGFEFFYKYYAAYEDCLKIHAICEELGYSKDDARLFTGIHYLIGKKGEELFQKESFDNEIFAVDIFLSSYKPKPLSKLHLLLSNLCIGLELKISENSSKAGDLEAFFTTQLQNMKKFYKDKKFRDDMFKTYKEIIKPKIAEYDLNKVKKVFEKSGEKEAKEKDEIKRLID